MIRLQQLHPFQVLNAIILYHLDFDLLLRISWPNKAIRIPYSFQIKRGDDLLDEWRIFENSKNGTSGGWMSHRIWFWAKSRSILVPSLKVGSTLFLSLSLFFHMLTHDSIESLIKFKFKVLNKTFQGSIMTSFQPIRDDFNQSAVQSEIVGGYWIPFLWKGKLKKK